ncbi:MAG: hypothetical protein QOJ83_2650, partial [Frankiales bacterium]|nr:hypothetical protein [Frankiales bacterium]
AVAGDLVLAVAAFGLSALLPRRARG